MNILFPHLKGGEGIGHKKPNKINVKKTKWWAMRDSNSRHPRCKRGALPTELIALNDLPFL
jgi:hypothetical protein